MKPLGNQFLDQLGTGRLVLDQHDVGIEQALLLADRTFQRGYSSRLRSTLSKYRFLPLMPQVVQTLKSLSSVNQRK